MKISELADALNCSRSKAYEIVKSGAVRSIVISGLLRVPVEALDALAAGSNGLEKDEAGR
jgi:excisionase family DNA binding protein